MFENLLGVGTEPKDLTLAQALARAAAVYLGALVIVRAGAQRFLGRSTVFDTILVFMLGSMMSRAINGSAPFVESVAAGALLVAIHGAFAYAAYHWHPFGTLVKGREHELVRDGRTSEDVLGRHLISERDLAEGLRHQGAKDLEDVSVATLERNGNISVVKRREPRILEVRVEPGVQVVRIEI